MGLIMQTKLQTEFTFAGFAWPRYVANMATLQTLYKKKAQRQFTGGYYHAPKPNASGRGFYLDDAGQPFTRWKWCDDVEGSIRHTGWFTDEYGDGEKIRGIVVYLPHGRFMAGWSMGEGMASSVDADLYDDETAAAFAADSMAETAAEKEREYQESNRECAE